MRLSAAEGQGRKENFHAVKNDHVGISFFEKSVPIKHLMDKSVSKSSCTEDLSQDDENDEDGPENNGDPTKSPGIESGQLGD